MAMAVGDPCSAWCAGAEQQLGISPGDSAGGQPCIHTEFSVPCHERCSSWDGLGVCPQQG